ncbi:MAG: hypothetical protein QOF37_1404 [Thermoleophilaceae bacterium]|jgi:hypothetical protein|nr:hypothetical protein [Thermoleophilaceae bacterium]
MAQNSGRRLRSRRPPPLQALELRVPGGGAMVEAVRWELFIHPDVRDVLATDRPDVVLVIHRGEPQPSRWLETLRSAGYDVMPGAGA